MTIDHTAEIWLTPKNSHANKTYLLCHADYVARPSCPQRFLFYKNEQQSANFMSTDVLVEALHKTLEYFPILYGRFACRDDGEYEIRPSQQGVRFGESFSSNDISIFEPNWGQSCVSLDMGALSRLPPEEEPVFAVQLTRFANNSGLALCIACHHYIADEGSFFLILRTWAALARGEAPIIPNHDRHLLRLDSALVKPQKRQHPSSIGEQLNYGGKLKDGCALGFHFSPDKLALLKQTAIESLSEKERKTDWFSTMDVVIMLLWRATIKARQLPDTHIVINNGAVNMRPFVPDLPITILVLNLSIGRISAMHRQAITAVKSEPIDVWVGRSEIHSTESLEDRKAHWLTTSDFIHTDWSKFGYYTIDFGEGIPTRCRRYIDSSRMLVIIFDSAPSPNTSKIGYDLCITIEKEHSERLINDKEFMSYFPILYGRFACRDDGEYEIRPSQQGVRFGESFSSNDISIFEPNWGQSCVSSDLDALSRLPPEEEPVFAVQLTRFANNSGLALCIACHHYVADEGGFFILLKTWAALARGEAPIIPNHDRRLLRLDSALIKPQKRQHPSSIGEQLNYGGKLKDGCALGFHFSPDKLALLKQTAIESLSEKERETDWFSTMDVVIMLLWRATIKARQLPNTHIVINNGAVNMRPFVPDLPDNYFGNTLNLSNLQMTAGEVLNLSIGRISAMHRQAVTVAKNEPIDVWVGRSEIHSTESLVKRRENWLTTSDFIHTDWSKFGYYTVDFGEGTPTRCRRYIYTSRMFVAIFDSAPSPNTSKIGYDLCITIEKEHSERLINDKEFMSYAVLLG
ncbi:transferase [Syncephalis fuscata]|nr:transferase [Syncephalis fuscata]